MFSFPLAIDMYLIQENEFGTVSVWKEDFLKWLPLLWILTTTWRNSYSLPQCTAFPSSPRSRGALGKFSLQEHPLRPQMGFVPPAFSGSKSALAAVAVTVAFGREVASASDRQRWTEVA